MVNVSVLYDIDAGDVGLVFFNMHLPSFGKSEVQVAWTHHPIPPSMMHMA
jgi:hypothetical protein